MANKSVTCPKCGEAKVGVRWHAADHGIGLEDCAGGAHSEHLRMVCGNCGYAWFGPIVSEHPKTDASRKRLDEKA